MRSIVVDGQQLRVAVRHGDGTRVPLLLFNGIGASLDLLQPFVDALDPSLEVIRFDVPGVGGSPLPARPYRFTGLCRLAARMLDRARLPGAVDVLGISWGGGVAQHFAAFQRAPLPPAGAGQHGDRRDHGAGPARGPGPDGHPAALPGSRLPAAHRARTCTAGPRGPTRRG